MNARRVRPVRIARAVVGLLALWALAAAWQHLARAFDGVEVHSQTLGTTPVTVFRPVAGDTASPPAPVVVIAHGFAGSQQLMQPFALTLARNGYIAVTFDFPGHGRNPTPMTGGLADPAQSQRSLLGALDQVTTFARTLAPEGGARYGLLGHSMASDIVVRHAQAHPEVAATVAVSLFAPSIGATTPGDSPRNLLVIAGAVEPAMMRTEALRVVGRVAGDAVRERRTYGRFDAGTARRAAFSSGVEHIGVLYSAQSQTEALAWFDQAFGRTPAPRPVIDARGPWLGLLLVGVVGLAWPLAGLLPRAAAYPTAVADAVAAPVRAGRFWLLALAPAVLTPLMLWKLPSDFLPILLGDYLLLHFGLYGVLSAVAGRFTPRRIGPPAVTHWPAVAVAGALTAGYVLLAVGVPLDLVVFNLRPTAERLPLIAVMAAGTLPYFLADEALTRGSRAPRGAYAGTKVFFLLSLVAAIALNPPKLFFLAIIVPAILLLFVVYGLFGAWVRASTGSPWPGAVANALVFAWFIAVTFPIVG